MYEANRCESVLDGDRCVKHLGHRGKHMNDDNFQYVRWTNGGLIEFLKEQEQIQENQQDQKAVDVTNS